MSVKGRRKLQRGAFRNIPAMAILSQSGIAYSDGTIVSGSATSAILSRTPGVNAY